MGSTTIQSGSPLVLEMYEVVSGQFGAPDHGSLQVWGSIEIAFGDPCGPVGSSAQIQGSDGSQSMLLTQFAGLPDFDCR